jgi:hypothetical protein
MTEKHNNLIFIWLIILSVLGTILFILSYIEDRGEEKYKQELENTINNYFKGNNEVVDQLYNETKILCGMIEGCSWSENKYP